MNQNQTIRSYKIVEIQDSEKRKLDPFIIFELNMKMPSEEQENHSIRYLVRDDNGTIVGFRCKCGVYAYHSVLNEIPYPSIYIEEPNIELVVNRLRDETKKAWIREVY